MVPYGLHVLEEQIPLDSGPCTDVDLLQHTTKIHGPYIKSYEFPKDNECNPLLQDAKS